MVDDLVEWMHFRFRSLYPELGAQDLHEKESDEMQLMAGVGEGLVSFSQQRGLLALAGEIKV